MSKINMGNDEFILYVRKQTKCKLKNDQLGKKIWLWLEKEAHGKQIGKRVGCEWGEEANNVNAEKLPYTATQFEFDRDKLPALYDYLDSL
ncbi:hypothetical protein [Parabacteroides goldsteinii]|uniref:hypothetical protein n=1 Tax=Parabacteroides goldsteinii TaxID=328812 RepID=UPI003219FB4B